MAQVKSEFPHIESFGDFESYLIINN
jgi:hypothetical protein